MLWLYKRHRRGGRVVDCDGLENRWARKGPGGSNPSPSATQNFTLTVIAVAPSINSANYAIMAIGTSGSFTVSAIGDPMPTLSESGALPSGVTFNIGTGVLSGTPASGTNGAYPITFTAQNGVGSNATQSFTLNVNASGGDVYYYFEDALGSSRVITNSAGVLCYDADFYPYGGERWYTSTCPPDFKFTGYERDTETGNDYASARFYSSALGRFMSPDPIPGNMSNPQSWNMYSDTRNNPINMTDPDGMDPNTLQYNNCCSGDGGGSWFGFGWGGGSSGWGGPMWLWSSFFSAPTPPPPPIAVIPLSNALPQTRDINKTWSGDFSCNKSATQLMSAVQSDMSHFANNRGLIFAANFPGRISPGARLAIQPGLNSHDGLIIPTGTLIVKVTSETANGWTFTTDPSQHYFDGTISFSATDTGSGNVNFSVTANANYSSRFWSLFGPALKAGENSTWGNLIRSCCTT
jgi:RHS repeat-associated protein